MIELRYNPQMHDFIEFNLFHSWNSPEKKRDRLPFILKHLMWVIAPLFIYCFILLSPVKDEISFALLFGFIISGVYMLYKLLTVKTTIRLQATKFYSDLGNRSFFEETILTITDSKIIVKQTSSYTEYLVASILRISENKGNYYLYTNTIQAIIVPKRVFASKDNLEEFKLLLKLNS